MKLLTLLLLLSSCAIKHHVQVGDIEKPKGKKLKPLDIKLSETGVNIEQATKLLSSVTRDQGRSQEIGKWISMFQMGPRTGNHIFNEKYADIIPNLILRECPSGKITGLTLIRETNKYPVVSGEIVRVTGYCLI